jgi:hypothetical protein
LSASHLVRRSLVASLALLAVVTPGAAVGKNRDEVRQLARSLSRSIGKPWPDRQYRNGRFVDEVGGHSAYGEAVLGYALVDAGLREHRRRWVRTGLRALRYATGHPSETSVFQNMAVGLAYRLADRRLGHDDSWRGIRRTVEDFMRRQELQHLDPENPHFGNHLLVEALEVLTYVGSGVTSGDPDAIVGPGRDYRYDFTSDFIRSQVPGLFAGEVRRSRGLYTLLFSDPPDMPLVYQGLSIGLYARAVENLGVTRAGSRAAELLRRALEASSQLVGPDGDLAYAGRNLEEGWALSATAYGARVASRLPGTSRSETARYDALALRALERLRDAHIGGPGGIYVVPALRSDFDRSRLAGDHGAGYAPGGGLALMFLDMLADEHSRDSDGDAGVMADHDAVAVLGHGASLYATQRAGDVWMAVRGRTSQDHATDLRYDAGLIRAKVRRGGGWRDLIPVRPLLPPTGRDSAGPLLRTGGGTAAFVADRLRAPGGDYLEMEGGYRRLRGTPDVHRHAWARFRPVSCGVQVSFPLRAGDRGEYSVFLRDPDNSGRKKDGVVRSGGAVVTADPKPRIAISHDWIAATDARVLRERMRWEVDERVRVRVRICADG